MGRGIIKDCGEGQRHFVWKSERWAHPSLPTQECKWESLQPLEAGNREVENDANPETARGAGDSDLGETEGKAEARDAVIKGSERGSAINEGADTGSPTILQPLMALSSLATVGS